MAGQPIKKAVQITALEAKMAEVCELLRKCMPDHYVERTPQELSRDPLGTAWVNAARAIENGDDFLGDLGFLLREKAGITLEEAEAAITKPRDEPAMAATAETVPTGG